MNVLRSIFLANEEVTIRTYTQPPQSPIYLEYIRSLNDMGTDPIHPGEHLAEILEEIGISQYRLAKAIGVPPRRINEIVHGRRSVTADSAVRIGQALGMTPEFWINLQGLYDLDLVRASTDVGGIEPLVAA